MARDIYLGFSGLQRWAMQSRQGRAVSTGTDGVILIGDNDFIRIASDGKYRGALLISLPEYSWAIHLPWLSATIEEKSRTLLLAIAAPKIDAGSLATILLRLRIKSWEAMANLGSSETLAMHRAEYLEDGRLAGVASSPFATIPIKRKEFYGDKGLRKDVVRAVAR